MVINPIAGVYIPIIAIPIKGEMTIPNIGSLDPGTCVVFQLSIDYQLSVAIGARNITADTRSAGHLRLSSMQASDK